MKRLIELLGVDYEQWKALTVAALRLDLRSSRFGGARAGRRRNASGSRAAFGQAIFYMLLGVFMAVMVSQFADRFVAATVVYSYVMIMVGTAMLLDHNTAITSPTDYGILGFQPITSRTFFASKLTNALVYTLAMTTALGLLPTVALIMRYGVAVGLATVVGLYVCATIVTLTIVAVYASLMRRVGATRLRSALSYLQMLTGFIVYGGYFMITNTISRATLSTFSLPRTPLLLLYPPTWFSSYLEIAAGATGAINVIPALVSLTALFLLGARLRGRLSLEYAEQLAALASSTSQSSPPRDSRSGPGFWFRAGEAGAVSILVRSHFRHDMRFRMGVLGIIPMTAIYLVMGLNGTAGKGGVGSSNLAFVTMAALFFPMLLKTNLAHSEAFRASWVFFASPTDRTRLIRASKNVLVAFFLVPYLMLVGAILLFFTRDPSYIVIYLLLVGLIGNIALLLMTLIDPALPFARPVERTRNSSRIFATMLVVGALAGVLPVLARLIRGNTTVTAIVFALVLGVTWVLNRLTRLRITRQAAHLEFEG